MTIGPVEESLELAANQPLLLDDGEAVWLVRNGQAVVFAVRLEDGQPAGARQYLFTAEAGEALFGVDPAASGAAVGLLAVGTPGTRALRCDRAWLREQALGAPEDGGLGLLERWIDRLSAALPDEMPPREYRPLAAPGEAELEIGEVAQTADGLAWVKIADGRVLFDGAEPLGLGPEDGAFPLARRAWLRAVGKTRLTSLDSRGALTDQLLEAGLVRFHALALRSVGLRLEAAAAADADRLERQVAADQQALEQGVAGLLSAYEPRRAADAFLAQWAEDPLLAACGLVGQALGVTIRPPARSEAGRRQVDPLGSIARASRIRMRAVTLDGDWWRHDNGPLLGYRQADARPVALLPKSGSRYVLVDPADGTRAPVTAALAATLAPTAHMFYRPFPDKRLGVLDLLRFGPPGRGRDLVTVLLAGMLGGLLGLATPLATGILVDRAIPAANHGQLFQLTLALLASAFGVAVFQLTRSIAFLRIEGRLDGAIQAAVWDRLLALPVPFFRGYSSGDLTMRAMSIDLIRQMLSGVVAAAALTAFFSLFSYLLLFYYDLSLALLATVLLLVAVGVTAGTTYLQLRHLRAMSEVGGRLAGLVLELLTGLAKLRVAGAEQRAFGVWARSYGDQATLARRAQEIVIGLNVFIAAFPLLALMAIFAVVAFQHSASLSTGTFLAFNTAFGQATAALLALSTAITIALQVVPLYERARPIFEALPEVDPARADPGELSGDVEVSHVTFRYTPDGPPVLQDVSFRAQPGEFIALVGPSGSGKSTLLRLLLGFEAPESGSIHYDGQDLAGQDVRAVRRQIGVVLQSGKLMPGDLYRNIVGSAPLTPDDAWEAARMAGLDEDIRAMPMGMFTVVIEGAGTLSGGQRQRLLIARAIVNRPRILLFDEATSALDNQTQAIVSRSLEGLRATRIVIAHRLSTIQRADRIYVIVAGRVVQSGSYDELMQQGGPFAELARRQLT